MTPRLHLVAFFVMLLAPLCLAPPPPPPPCTCNGIAVSYSSCNKGDIADLGKNGDAFCTSLQARQSSSIDRAVNNRWIDRGDYYDSNNPYATRTEYYYAPATATYPAVQANCEAMRGTMLTWASANAYSRSTYTSSSPGWWNFWNELGGCYWLAETLSVPSTSGSPPWSASLLGTSSQPSYIRHTAALTGQTWTGLCTEEPILKVHRCSVNLACTGGCTTAQSVAPAVCQALRSESAPSEISVREHACMRQSPPYFWVDRGNNDHEDMFVPWATRWTTARSLCQTWGGDLGTLGHNQSFANEVRQYVYNNYRSMHEWGGNQFWTGLYKNSGNYGWYTSGDSYVAANLDNVPNYGSSSVWYTTAYATSTNYVFNTSWSSEPGAVFFPFICSRRKYDVESSTYYRYARLDADRQVPCIVGFACRTRWKSSESIRKYHTGGPNMVMEMVATGAMSGTTDCQFPMNSNECVVVFTPSSSGTINLANKIKYNNHQHRMLPGSESAWLIVHPKLTASVLLPTTGKVVYPGNTIKIQFQRNDVGCCSVYYDEGSPVTFGTVHHCRYKSRDVPTGSITYCNTAACTNLGTFAGTSLSGDYKCNQTAGEATSLVVSASATTGTKTIFFNVASQYYNSVTPSINIEVRPRGTIAVSLPGTAVAENDFQITLTPSHDVGSDLRSFEVRVSSTCGADLALVGSWPVFNPGANAAKILTLRPSSAYTTLSTGTTCTLSWSVVPTTSSGAPHEQFDAPSGTNDVSVQPKVRFTVTGWSASMSANQNYALTVAPNIAPLASSTVTLSCGGTEAVPGSPGRTYPAASTTGQTFTFNFPGSTTCNLAVAVVSGSQTYFRTDQPNPSTTVTSSLVVVSQGPSTAFVSEVVTVSVTAPATSLATGLIDITWTWTGTAGVFSPATGSTQLNNGKYSHNFVLIPLTNGTGTISFALQNQPVSFLSTVSPIALVVNPLQTFTVTQDLPNTMSIGYKYKRTVTLTIPAKPASGSLTVTPSVDPTYLAFNPPSATWSSADEALDPKVFEFYAVGDTPASPFHKTDAFIIASGNAAGYDTGANITCGSVNTYPRAIVNATNASHVIREITIYTVGGQTVDFTMTRDSNAPNDEIFDMSYPAHLSGPANFTILSGTTSAAVALTPTGSGIGLPFDITFAVNAGQTNSVKSKIEGDIAPLTVTLLAPLTVAIACNASTLYFGPGHALSCTATIPSIPSSGQVSMSTNGNGFFTIDPPSAALTAVVTYFTVTPITSATFSDGASQNVAFTVADTSESYVTGMTQVALTMKKLSVVAMALATSAPYFDGVQFSVSVAAPRVPAVPLNVTTPVGSFTYTPSTFLLSSTAAQLVTVTGPAGTHNLQFNVARDNTFAALTAVLSNVIIQTKSALTISSTVLNTSYTGAETFVSQVRDVKLFTGSPPSAGLVLNVSLEYHCNGVNAPDKATFAISELFLLPGQTQKQTTLLAVAPCANGVIKATSVYGSAAVYYNTPPNVQTNVLAQRTITARTTNKLYGSIVPPGTNPTPGFNTSLLKVELSHLPLTSAGTLSVTVSNANTTLLRFSDAAFSPTYLGSDPVELRVAETILSALIVDETRIVELTFTLSGSAVSQYNLLTPKLNVTVHPLEQITLDSSLATNNLVFVGPEFERTLSFSLPTVPDGGGNVVITGENGGGLTASAISWNPKTITLNASRMSGTLKFTPIAEANSGEFITYAFTGTTASNYRPSEWSAPSYPVTFKNRGSISVVAPNLNQYQNTPAPVAVTASWNPPTGYANLVVGVTVPGTGGCTAIPSSLTWVAGSSAAVEKSFDLSCSDLVPPPGLNITLVVTSGPNIYLPKPNPSWFVVNILDARSIIVDFPKFIYYNPTQPIEYAGTCTIQKKPTSGKTLELAPSFTGNSAPITFVPESRVFPQNALVVPFTLIATYSSPPVSIVVNRLQSAAGDYNAPDPHVIEVRALETIIVSGMHADMYVGTTMSIGVSISRLPPCAGTELTITPQFGSGDGNFQPPQKVWLASGDPSQLSTTFVLTATGETPSPVGVIFQISSTNCADNTKVQRRFESVAQQPVDAVRIHPRNVINIRTLANMTDSDGAFAYELTSVPITVDLGTPPIAHTGVTVSLAYLGRSTAAVFQPARLVFAPGELKKDVYVTAAETNPTPASLSATIDVGTEAFRLPTTLPKLRLLPRVQAQLSFNPATTLLVANTSRTLTFSLASAAIAGSITVALVYGPEIIISDPLTFQAKTPQLSGTFSLQMLNAISPHKDLSVVITGSGAEHYTLVTASFSVPVLPQKYVQIKTLSENIYVGAENRRTMVLELQSLPTLANDEITVTFSTAPAFTFNETSVVLTANRPSAAIDITGTVFQMSARVRSFITVSSSSQEFASSVIAVVGVTTRVNILNKLTATLQGFVPTMYIFTSATFNVTLPSAPLSGQLDIVPTLGNTQYPLAVNPPTVTFGPGERVKSVTVTAQSDQVMPPTRLSFVSAGSTEFETVAATAEVEVILPNQLGLAGWRSFLYPGAVNKFTVTTSVAVRPLEPHNLTITPTSASGAVSNLTFIPNATFYNNFTEFSASFDVIAIGAGAPAPESVSFELRDTNNFYEPIGVRSVQVRPLETVATTVSATTAYLGESPTVTLRFSTAPTVDCEVEIFLKKNRTGASKIMDPVPETEAFIPARTVFMRDLTTATFTISVLTAPLNVEISFELRGPGANVFDVTTLKKHLMFFAPLRTLTATAPSTMYVGLASTFEAQLSEAPEAGVVTINTVMSPALNVSEPPTFTWDAIDDPLVQTFVIRPATAGVANILLFSQTSGTNAYEGTIRPSSEISIVVKNPALISVKPLPLYTYVGSQNSFTIQVVVAELLVNEDLEVTLHSNNSNVAIFPSTAVNLMHAAGQIGVFTVYCSVSQAASFYVTFSSSRNRFALHPSLLSENTFPSTFFRPLKRITVTPPEFTEYLAYQPVSFSIQLEAGPSPGHQILVSVEYSGAVSAISATSTLPQVYWETAVGAAVALAAPKTITLVGRGQTDLETVTLVFTKDSEYVLASYSFQLKIKPLLQMYILTPKSAYSLVPVQVAITLQESKIVSVTPELPSGDPLFSVQPPTVTFALNDPLTKYFTLTPLRVGTGSIHYNVSDAHATQFNPPPDAEVTVVDPNVLIVHAAEHIRLYTAEAHFIDVRIEIGNAPPLGQPLNVSVAFSCVNGVPDFVEVAPSQVSFRAGDTLVKTIRFRGLKVRDTCSITFPVAGGGGQFTGTTTNFKVSVRDPHEIALAPPPTRVFLGKANAFPLTINLDPFTPKWSTLTQDLSVTFQPNHPCLAVSPRVLHWTPGNENEPNTKAVSLEASCVGDGLTVSIVVNTTNVIFLSTVPTMITLDAKPLLVVTAEEQRFANTNYYMFVEGTPLAFRIRLPEALRSTESLSVVPTYKGTVSSIRKNDAFFSGQTMQTTADLEQFVQVEGVGVSPLAQFTFTVAGPPRFAPQTSNGGFLEVFGPLPVTATVPSSIYVGSVVDVIVTVGDRTFPGESITVTPKWEGDPSAVAFEPASVTWTDKTMNLQQSFKMRALKRNGPYNIRVGVNGSARFVSVAFNGPVSIVAPQQIVARNLPRQLMMGQIYSLTVDIGVLPASSGDVVDVHLYPQPVDSVVCISLPAKTLSFRRTAVPNPVQSIDVTVVTPCSQPSEVRFAVGGNGSATYNRTMTPVAFETVPAAKVGYSWLTQAFVGAANAPEVIFTLFHTLQAGETVAMSVTWVNTTATGAATAGSLQWTETTPAEQALTVFGTEPGMVEFTLEFTSNVPILHNLQLPKPRTTFFLLPNITRSSLPATLFEGSDNKFKVWVNLSHVLPLPENAEPPNISVTPVPASSSLRVQPATLSWGAQQTAAQFFYVWGITATTTPVSLDFFVVTGESLVGNQLASAATTVLPLQLVDFTPPPAVLYVGARNQRTVTVTIPANVAMDLAVLVDGERNAVSITPSTLTWTTTAPRSQTIVVRGNYGTPIRCRLRYLITKAPPYVSVRNTLDSMEIRALLQLQQARKQLPDGALRLPMFTDDPNLLPKQLSDGRYLTDPAEFTVPEMTNFGFSFRPSTVVVECTTDNNQTTVTFKPENNGTALFFNAPALVAVSCLPEASIYAPVPTFYVHVSPRKTMSLSPLIETFVGSGHSVPVTLSAPPSATTLVITPRLTNITSIMVTPTILLFSTRSQLSQSFVITGLQKTDARLPLTFAISGPANEYRLPNGLLSTTFLVNDKVNVTVRQAPDALVKTIDADGVASAYVGPTTGWKFEVSLTGPTLTGPVRIQVFARSLAAATETLDLTFGPPVALFETGATELTKTFRVLSQVPTGPIAVWVSALGPEEFIEQEMLEVGRIRFVPLETIDVLDSLPEVIFIGTGNAQRLEVRLSEYPMPGQTVSVLARAGDDPRTDPMVITPAFLEWQSLRENTEEVLTKSFLITGRLPHNAATVTLSWLRRSAAAATTFAMTPRPSTKQLVIRDVYGFHVSTPENATVHLRSAEIFSGAGNAKTLHLNLDGLPVHFSDEVHVQVIAEDPGLLTVPADFVFSQAITSRGTATLRTFTIFSPGDQSGNTSVLFRFNSGAPNEFDKTIRYVVNVVVKNKLRFEVTPIPTTIPTGGIANVREFQIRPVEPASLLVTQDRDGGDACSEIRVGGDRLSWQDSNEWRTVQLTSGLPSPSNRRCIVRLTVDSGASSLKYVDVAVESQVRSILMPRVVTPSSRPLFTIAQVRGGTATVDIRLSGDGFYRFLGTQVFVGTGEAENANNTITLTSNTAVAAQPDGVMATAQRSPAQFIRFQPVQGDGTTLRMRLGPVAGFQTSNRETVALRVKRTAIHDDIQPDPAADTFYFEIEGSQASVHDADQAQVTLQTTGAAAAVGGALSLGAATQAGKIDAIMSAFNCPNPLWKKDQEDIPWFKNIFGGQLGFKLSIGSDEDVGTFATAGLSVLMLLVFFAIIHLGVAYCVYRYRLTGPYFDKSFAAGMAYVRFPSLLMFPVLLYYQATVEYSLKAVLYSPKVVIRMVGALSLLFIGIGTPVFLYTRTVAGFNAAWDEAPPAMREGKSFLKRLLIMRGRWLAKPSAPTWVLRNGLFFDEFRTGWNHFMLIDVLFVFILGCVGGWVPVTYQQCVAKLGITVGLFVIQALLMLGARPYRIDLFNVFFSLGYISQMVAMILIAVAFWKKDPNWEGVESSGTILMAFSFLLVGKMFHDIVLGVLECKRGSQIARPSTGDKDARLLDDELALEVPKNEADGSVDPLDDEPAAKNSWKKQEHKFKTVTAREEDAAVARMKNEIMDGFERDRQNLTMTAMEDPRRNARTLAEMDRAAAVVSRMHGELRLDAPILGESHTGAVRAAPGTAAGSPAGAAKPLPTIKKKITNPHVEALMNKRKQESSAFDPLDDL